MWTKILKNRKEKFQKKIKVQKCIILPANKFSKPIKLIPPKKFFDPHIPYFIL